MDPFRDRLSLVGYADKSPGISLLDNAVKLDDPESLNFTIDGSQDQIPATVSYVLRKACVHGSRNMVKFILKNLGQIQRSKLDKSLVETCIRHSGDRDIVKSLFNVGISRTNLTDLGDTDVHLAVRYDKSLLLEDLLTNQEGLERINICNHYGVFPLLLAMKLKHVSCFKVLVHAGADVNQKLEGLGEEPELAEIYSEFTAQIGFFSKPLPGDSLMHVLLKKLGIRIFYKNVQEYFSYESIFDVIINCTDMDFTVTNAEGRSILDEAIISLCDPRVLDRLIEKGCCLLLSNPYHYASFEDSVERLEVIKSLGYDLNATDSPQFSPLFVACLDHNVKVVSWLLENGANPTTYVNSRVLQNWIANVSKISDNLIPDQRIVVTKMTPLHVTLLGSMSVFMSAVPILEMMCAHGANINAQTSAGETPLFYATRDALGDDNFPLLPAYFEPFGPEELLFILLIQAGADPEIGTDAGKFPIMFCIPESLSRIALMFLEVSTNLMKYFAVRENERKVCRVSDMSFLPISESFLRTLITNPRKLQVLCRKTIIQACKGRHINNPNCFQQLPQKVQNYINLKYLTESEWYQNPYTLF